MPDNKKATWDPSVWRIMTLLHPWIDGVHGEDPGWGQSVFGQLYLHQAVLHLAAGIADPAVKKAITEAAVGGIEKAVGGLRREIGK